MKTDKKIDIAIRISTGLITLLTILIGVWQFNKGQSEIKDREFERRSFELNKMRNQAHIETLTKFKENQNKIYVETITVVAYLTVHTDYTHAEYKQNIDKFWRLYWVELSSVETASVETSMVTFGEILKRLQLSGYSNIREEQPKLKVAGYEIAQAIKESAKLWILPEELQVKGDDEN